MNKRQQELFLSFFEELHQTQQLIDLLKSDLSKIEGFNPHILFDSISGGTDVILPKHLRSYLSERISCSDRQLYELFEKFDWSRQGTISREDFIRELTPFGKEVKKYKNHTQGSHHPSVEAGFIALVLEILKRFRIVDVSRKQIVFIQPYDAFAHLDIWKKGIIGLRELQRFYEDNDFEIGQRQLFYLLHALRRRCFREVNLEVFCENLNPLQFGEYFGYSEEINAQREKQFMRRSRNQEDAMRRSRIEGQKLDHEIQRAERRKQAEIERQLCMEEKINHELLDYDRRQEENMRRALIEEEQLRLEAARNAEIERVRLLQVREAELAEARQLQRVRQMEAAARAAEAQRRQVQEKLTYERELELLQDRERERIANEQRLALSAYRQAQIDSELEAEQSRRRLTYERELALRQELERDREARARVSRAKDLEQSRRELEANLASQRERMAREREAAMRVGSYGTSQSVYSSARNVNATNTPAQIRQSRRVQELEKQLEATRAEMRERKSRLEARGVSGTVSKNSGAGNGNGLSSEVKPYNFQN